MNFGVLQVGDKQIAIPASDLVEAVEWPEHLMEMPQPGKLMRGVFMLRGRIIPVVALSRLIEVDKPGEPAAVARSAVRGRVAVVAHGGLILGIAVDDIGGVVRMSAAHVTTAGDGLFGRWIVGNPQHPGHAMPVLDIPQLMTLPGVTPAGDGHGSAGVASAGPVSQDRQRYTLARIGSTVVAFDFADVPDVSRRPVVQPFFACSEALRGRVTWRGQERLLVDLAELLGFEKKPAAGADRPMQGIPLILVLQSGDTRIAVEADELLGLLSLPASALVPLGNRTTREPARYRGSIHTGIHGVALVLRADMLMAHPLVATFLRTAPKTVAVVEDRSAARATERCAYLIYQAGGHCATRLADVEEILAYSGDPIPIDGLGGGMRGLMVWRDKPLELFCLRQLLGRAAVPENGQARVLVIQHDGVSRGFLVDRLVSLVTVQEATARKDLPKIQGTSGFSGDRLLTTGSGPDAFVCQRLDLKALAVH